MKYGVNALIWTASFELEHLVLLPRVKQRGFSGIEIPIFNPGATPVGEIRRGLEDNGLEVTTCTVIPNGLTVFAESAGIREQALDHIKASIETTAPFQAARTPFSVPSCGAEPSFENVSVSPFFVSVTRFR